MYKGIMFGIAGVILVLGTICILGKHLIRRFEDIMNKPLGQSPELSEAKTKFLGVALVVFSGILFFMARKIGF